MKAMLFVCALIVSTAVSSSELRIFAQHLTIGSNCILEVKLPDGSAQKKSLPLGDQGECSVVNLGGTNIPHLEWVSGGYVFLVESRQGSMGACRAVYSAVAVARDGKVKILPKTKRSQTCGSDHDRAAFEYLYYYEQGPK